MGWLADKQAADQTLPIITSTAKYKPAAVSTPHMESANIKAKQIYIGEFENIKIIAFETFEQKSICYSFYCQ